MVPIQGRTIGLTVQLGERNFQGQTGTELSNLMLDL